MMNPNKKIYISAAIFGALSILLIVFLIYPLFKEIKKNSEKFFLEKQKLTLISQERESLAKLKEDYKTYQSDLEKIENLLIDSEVPIEFTGFLEETAKISEVESQISSMTKNPQENDPWPSLSFQILVNGSFPNFLEFLEKLENCPHLIEILNLNIRRLTERELEKFPLGDAAVSLLMKVYTK